MNTRRSGRCGQTVTETAILLIVIVVALVAMQTYLKRSVQGRLRGDIDQIGAQYDFTATTSNFTQTQASNVTTISTMEIQPVTVPNTAGTIDRAVTTSLTTTHYDNTTRQGREVVGNF